MPPRTRRGFLPAESEDAFQMKVIQLARFGGWWVYHPPPNRPGKSGRVPAVLGVVAGWPDLTMVREPEIIFAELKAETGKVRQEQTIVIEKLRACGLEVHVWRPSDWLEIEARLARRR